MENYTIILFVLGVMVLLSALADKIKIASPIVLICTGIAIGFLPGMPGLAIDPHLFLPYTGYALLITVAALILRM